MAAETAENKFYTGGNYAPIHEEFTLENLEIEGQLPTDLNGSFVRNGSNPRFEPNPDYHWFLGDGMLHSFNLKNGKASYRNRYVRTAKYEAESLYQKSMFPLAKKDNPLLLKAMGMNFFSFLWNVLLMGDWDRITNFFSVANTSVVRFAGKNYALVESSAPTGFSLPELETLAVEDFGCGFQTPFSAHPKFDGDEMFSFGYRMFNKPYLRYYVVDKQHRLKLDIPIEIPYPVMMHDFVITKDYAVFPVYPALLQKGQGLSVKFKAELPSLIGFMPRYGPAEQIQWFELPSHYVYHFLNSHSEGRRVEITGIKYNGLPLFSNEGSQREIDTDLRGIMTRFIFELDSKTWHEEPVDETTNVEFGRINERFSLQKNKLGYAAGFSENDESFNSIVRFDLEKNSSDRFTFDEGQALGEPVFAPRPGGTNEADGYLLNIVYDQKSDCSFLAVIDAARFADGPVAKVKLPHRVPFGFHGQWFEA